LLAGVAGNVTFPALLLAPGSCEGLSWEGVLEVISEKKRELELVEKVLCPLF
jgi:hypothetical protein